MDFEIIAKNAKNASLELADLNSDIKNEALLKVAKNIENNAEELLKANKKDLDQAVEVVSSSVYNRLKLDENKIRDIIRGIKDVAELENPIGKTLLARQLDEGLNLYKISCPIGVLGIIFEARPDVIAQISSLAIKSSNAVILKGGKEAINTNKKMLEVINNALSTVQGFPKNVISQIFTHEEVGKMLICDEYVDLIIPRGGNKLVKFVKENTRIPVLGHADGICHIYIDSTADLEIAKKVIIDSKTQYPSACNSVETLLINSKFLKTQELLKTLEKAEIELVSSPTCWAFEYGCKTLAYKFVENVQEAINHINTYGSGHTDCIVTNNEQNAELFMQKVDSAGVYKNVSTRFADGFRYGFGAEVGISTSKTHARGPVGLEGLTIYKYKLIGNGQIVKDYVDGVKHFNHKDI